MLNNKDKVAESATFLVFLDSLVLGEISGLKLKFQWYAFDLFINFISTILLNSEYGP